MDFLRKGQFAGRETEYKSYDYLLLNFVPLSTQYMSPIYNLDALQNSVLIRIM